MAFNLMPMPKQAFHAVDASGRYVPIVGGKVYTYQAGTTTPKATYTDSTGGTAQANPVVLDARGEASVWLADGLYKIVLKDASDSEIWTVDGVSGSGSGSYDTVITSLRANAGLYNKQVVNVLGCYSVGDGGGGVFYWDSTSSATETIGTIVRPTAIDVSAQGRWKRIYEGPLNVKWFGAKGDGTTDDTAAFHAAITIVAANGGGQVDCPFGRAERYAVNLVIANQRGVHINGTGWTKQSYSGGTEVIYGCLIPADVTKPVIRIGDDDGTGNATLTSGTILSNLTLCGTGASRGQIGLKIIGGAYRCVYDNVSILGFTLKGIWAVVAANKFAYYQFFTGLSVISGDAGAACIYLDGSGNGAGGSANVTSFFFDKVTIATGLDAACRGIVVKSAQATFSDTYVQLSNSRHDIGLELIQVGTEAAPNVTGNSLVIDGVGRFEDNNGSPIYRGIPTVFMNIPAVTVAGQKPISNYLRGTFTIDGLIRLYDSGVPAVTIDPEVYEGSAVMSDQVSASNFGAYSWFRSPIMTDGKVANKLYFVNLINPELTNLYVSAGTGDTPLLTFTAPAGVNVTTHWRVGGHQVVGARVTGWAATYAGSATRSTFDTTTVTTAQLAERVKALLDDLITHGLIGAS